MPVSESTDAVLVNQLHHLSLYYWLILSVSKFLNILIKYLTNKLCVSMSFPWSINNHKIVFMMRTCYRDGCSPRHPFSCHTCYHSCGESHCAATLGLSLYLPIKNVKEFNQKKSNDYVCLMTWINSWHTTEAGVEGRRFHHNVLAGRTTPTFGWVWNF